MHNLEIIINLSPSGPFLLFWMHILLYKQTGFIRSGSWSREPRKDYSWNMKYATFNVPFKI